MDTKKCQMTRRQLLRVFGIGAGGALLAACAPAAAPAAPTAAPVAPEATAAPAATEVPAATAPAEPAPTTAPAAPVGRALPEDAAPIEQQVFVQTGPKGSKTDTVLSSYDRPVVADLWSVPLTRLNKDFEIVPGSASEWKQSEDGLTWTFKIRDDMNWSDDTPLTADDFIATLQHMTNPGTGYDFIWYFQETKIANMNDIVEGKKTPDTLGIKKGATDKELIIETTQSVPYLPMMLVYFGPLQAKALKAHGPDYNTNSATAVSCGSYIVNEWSPNRQVAVANAKAAPDLQPYIQKVIGIPIEAEQQFQAYKSGQIDSVGVSNTADIAAVLADPELAKQASPDVGDFRCDYFFFDTSKPPFDNLKVRQAFSHLLDREAIVENITTTLSAKPAYSFLAPGFPGHNPDLKSIQNYDIEKAKALYAESGVKIDKLVLQVRGDGGETRRAIAQVFADSIKENLGIDIEVQMVDRTVFMDDLNARPDTKIQFGFVSYGMDYMDQSNMLGVFRTGGRHNWNNEAYQKMLDEAGPMVDKAKRDALYRDAEKLLVEDVAGVFATWRTNVNLLKPYLKGKSLEAGAKNTVPGMSFPGFSNFALTPTDTYITKDVVQLRPNPPA
jgi:peptide/nickel transport system substrate-binding protein/oligopeptide transport system substrate-binding protein